MPITILMAEDDEDDRLLTEEAIKENHIIDDFFCVEDGVDLLSYLRREGKYRDKKVYKFPHLIFLDLNMPKMDGREALFEIKNDPKLKAIPIIILTTSKSEEDMVKGYAMGAASFISKPDTFEKLVALMKGIGHYWIDIVELPNRKSTRILL